MPVSPFIPLPSKSSLGRNLLIAGGASLPLILAGFWLAFGRITALGISIAASVLVTCELLGVLQILQQRRALARSRPQRVRDPVAAAGAGMKVQLCRKRIERLGDDGEALLTALRDRKHVPVIRECLSRCQECKSGMVMAIADGVPLATSGSDELLRDLDELSAEEG